MTAEVNTVLVVGATGQTGRVLVATTLEHGLRVRALARDVDRARRLLPGTDAVFGDLTDAATLTPAVEGVDAVIFTHGATGGRGAYERVDYGAVVNVLRALGDRRPRIALMTSINVTTTIDGPYADLMSWKRRSERLVRPAERPTRLSGPGGSTPPGPATTGWCWPRATPGPARSAAAMSPRSWSERCSLTKRPAGPWSCSPPPATHPRTGQDSSLRRRRTSRDPSTRCGTLLRCRSMPNRPPCVVTLRQRPLDDESRTI